MKALKLNMMLNGRGRGSGTVKFTSAGLTRKRKDRYVGHVHLQIPSIVDHSGAPITLCRVAAFVGQRVKVYKNFYRYADKIVYDDGPIKITVDRWQMVFHSKEEERTCCYREGNATMASVLNTNKKKRVAYQNTRRFSRSAWAFQPKAF
jgi:hypothetical protein